MRDIHPRARTYMRQFTMSMDWSPEPMDDDDDDDDYEPGAYDTGPELPEYTREDRARISANMRRMGIPSAASADPNDQLSPLKYYNPDEFVPEDQVPSWQPGATTGDPSLDRQADVAAEAFEKEYGADPTTQAAAIAKYRPWFEQKVGRFGTPGNEDEAMAAVILTMRGAYAPMNHHLGHLFTDEQWARLTQMGLAVGPRTGPKEWQPTFRRVSIGGDIKPVE